MMRHFSFLFIAILCATFPLSTLEATAGFVDGVWLSHDTVTDAAPVNVYAVVRNQTGTPVSGIATLLINEHAARAQEVTVAARDIVRIAFEHRFSVGTHRVAVSFTATSDTAVDQTMLAPHTIEVLADTDADGIPDQRDTDDDNDGIPDIRDDEPYKKAPTATASSETETLSARGQAVLSSLIAQVTGRGAEGNETAALSQQHTTDTATTTNTMRKMLAAVEQVRKVTSGAVNTYREEQRSALADITAVQEHNANVEGFEPSAREESARRSHQIAAASAAVAGTILEYRILFYGFLAAVFFGFIYLLIRRVRRRWYDEEEYDE